MKNIAAILSIALLSAGCINGKFIKESVSNNCEGFGWTHTIVHYGDSRIIVIPLSEVARGEEFRFYLVPQQKGNGAQNWSDATVTIQSEGGWFAPEPIQGSADNKDYIWTCISDSTTKDQVIKYTVEVTKDSVTNVLDPRAVVVKN